MFALSLPFAAVVAVFVLMYFPNFRQRIEDILVGTYYNARFAVRVTWIASLVLIVLTVLWIGVCSGLFVLALSIPSMGLMIFALLMALIPFLVVMYVFLALHTITGDVSTHLLNAGSYQIPLVVPVPTTFGTFATILAYLGLTGFNAIRLLVVIPWNFAMSLLVAIGTIGQVASGYMKWAARLIALVNLYLLALMSVGLFQMQFEVEIINFATVFILFVILAVLLSMGVLLDWKLGMEKMPASGTVMAVIALCALCLVFSAKVAPVFANGVAVTMENGANAASKWTNGMGVITSKSKYVQYVMIQDLYGNKDVFKKDAGETFRAISEVEAVFLKKGAICVALDPKINPDKSTPEPMVQLYCPDITDPRKIQLKTRTDRYYWIPVNAIAESVETGSGGAPELPVNSTGGTKIAISSQSYFDAKWANRGPVFEPSQPGSSDHLWMADTGYITYQASLANISDGGGTVSVKLSSELLKRTSTDKSLSSDVTLTVNGQNLGSTNVIPDDLKGADYSWAIPNGTLVNGSNTFKFEVNGGKHQNGLAIYSPVLVNFR